MYIFLYLAVFEIPPSSQVLDRQRSKSCLLLLGNSMGPSVHPRCFPQSLLALILPQEFLEAGSSLATTHLKIESILNLRCNIYCEKLFLRNSSSSLQMPSIMASQKQRNESLENICTVYRKTSEQEPNIKQLNTKTKEQRKCNAKSLVDSPKYQSTKKSSACYGGIRNNFSQSCQKRTQQVAFTVGVAVPRDY